MESFQRNGGNIPGVQELSCSFVFPEPYMISGLSSSSSINALGRERKREKRNGRRSGWNIKKEECRKRQRELEARTAERPEASRVTMVQYLPSDRGRYAGSTTPHHCQGRYTIPCSYHVKRPGHWGREVQPINYLAPSRHRL